MPVARQSLDRFVPRDDRHRGNPRPVNWIASYLAMTGVWKSIILWFTDVFWITALCSQ